jgi:predicted nucleic acid-binding protein
LILTDTTVLSNFSQIERPDLLRETFPDLVAPAVVREELVTGERLRRIPVCDWSWLKLIDLSAAEQTRAAGLQRHVQAGEAACLAVAEARGGYVLTDDSTARKAAAALGIQVSGTIGVLVRLVQRDHLPLAQADALLADMMSRGYRSPIQSLQELLPGT